MFADERRIKITELLSTRPSVTVAELIDSFHVSIETIRRDLEYLENQGALKRVHGGAVSITKMKSYSKLSDRVCEHQKEKMELAIAAASHIKNGDIIALDAGSTSLSLASYLKNAFTQLTIITNSIDIFNILSISEGFEVILAGGYYHKNEKIFYGHMTLDMIQQFHASKYFLTPSAVSIGFGISDFVKEMLPIQRAFLTLANEVFVVADSSKFETSATLKICDLNPTYTYVTDSGLSDTLRQVYREHNIIIG